MRGYPERAVSGVAVVAAIVAVLLPGAGNARTLDTRPTGGTELASVLTAAPRYARPGVREHGMVPTTWYQRPSVLPVLRTRPGWVRVLLAQPPAGSAAWIPARDVRLGWTPYRIAIDLARTRLTLFDRRRRVFSAPAGVGSPADPTPAGRYFVVFTEHSPGPGYGPFVLVTSDRSRSISDWEGSGNALIAIHGPLGAAGAIAAGDARISHGCIRLLLPDLLRLRRIRPGTPVDIIR